MTLRIPIVAALLGTLVASLTAMTVAPSQSDAPATALAPARVTVTIKAEGVELSGRVRSRRPSCVAERNVLIIRQHGTRGGGDDQLFHADTSDAQGRWNGGNTGVEGRFYAKVKRTPRCQAATSPTVRAVRPD